MYYYIVNVDISDLLQYLGPFDCFRQRPDNGLNSRNMLPELPALCVVYDWFENIYLQFKTQRTRVISECLLVAESFISAQDTVNRLLMPTPQLTYTNSQIPRSYLKCSGRLHLDTSTMYNRQCEVYVCKYFNVSNCTDVTIYPTHDCVNIHTKNSELCIDGYQMFMCCSTSSVTFHSSQIHTK
jgi:hypothetical protein